ncbi:MAG TPA: hypothetical protein VM554_08805 [Acidisarcina sp.]|nr:hypothetical protein [Acidisarcina sp.]
MSEQPMSGGLSLKIMMLVLFLVLAVAGGIAYLLVYPSFHRQHIPFTTGAMRYFSGGVTVARSAIITGMSS